MKDEAQKRKETPIKSGVLDYFPDAIADVARVSYVGNEQHNPGSPLHWDRSKSGDELDALSRHLMDAGTIDSDGMRHSAKVAWRALANLQKEIEREAQEEWEEEIITQSKEDDFMYPVPGSVEADLLDIEREEELERRMKIIGQNGNDGLHYGVDEDGKGFVRYPLSDYPESNWTKDATFNIKDAKITIDGGI